jgi:hypothetical protein
MPIAPSACEFSEFAQPLSGTNRLEYQGGRTGSDVTSAMRDRLDRGGAEGD